MQKFEKFNPFEASQQKGASGRELSDPRNPTPPLPEPMRGLPNSSDTPTPNAPEKSPVDVMEEIWQTELKPTGTSVQKISDDQLKTLSTNFQPTIDPEQLAEAQNDPAKLAELLTNVSRQAFTSAATVSSELASNYLDQDRSAIEQRTQQHLTKSNVLSAVGTLNPALVGSGPFKKMTEDLVTKYLTKNPDASPAEVAKNINSYVSAKLGIPEKPVQTGSEATEEPKQNWVEFLES